jgi:hypothetical protein
MNLTTQPQPSGELIPREELLTLVRQQLSILSQHIDSYTQGVVGEDLTNWMQDLNLNLRAHPDIVHLLSDEEIAPLYRGMLIQKGIVFEKAKEPKEKKPRAAKQSKLTSGLVFKGTTNIDLSDL